MSQYLGVGGVVFSLEIIPWTLASLVADLQLRALVLVKGREMRLGLILHNKPIIQVVL